MDLVARLTLQDELSGRMRKVTGELDKADRSTKTLSDRMDGLKGVLATVGITTGIAAISKSVVDAGIEYSSTMSRVQAVSGATQSEMKELGDQARQLGKDTLHSASDAADAQAFLGQAGFEVNEIMKTMPGLLDLATAGALDVGVAADIASNVMSGFNMEAEDMGRISDVLAHSASSANTSVEEMGQAMSYVAPVAASLDVSMEETAASIGILSDAGIQGSRAGTTLRGILSSLNDPSKDLAKGMQAAGMSVEDVSPRFNSLADIIENLEKAGYESSDALELVGQEAGPGLAAMLALGSDALREQTGELEKSEGAAKRMADVMSDNLGADIEILKSGINEAQLTVFYMFEDVLRDAIQMASKFVAKVPAIAEVVAKITKPFMPLIKAVGKAVAIIGSMVALVGVFKLIGVALAFLVSPVGLVIGGVTALVLAFESAYKASEPFRNAIDGVVNAVKGLYKTLTEGDLSGEAFMMAVGMSDSQIDAVLAFSDALKDAFDKIKGVVEGFSEMFAGNPMEGMETMMEAGFSMESIAVAQAFAEGLRGVYDTIIEVFDGIGEIIAGEGPGDLLDALGFSPEAIITIEESVNSIKEVIGSMFTYIAEKWEEMQPGIAVMLEAFSTAKEVVLEIFTSAMEILAPIFSGMMTSLSILGDIAVEVFNNIMMPAVNYFMTAFQTMWAIVGPILGFLGAAFEATFAVLKLAWDTILKPVVSFIMGKFSSAIETATTIVEALGKGFDVVGGAIEWATDKLKAFTDWLKKPKVPKWMSDVGGAIGSGAKAVGGWFSNYHGKDRVPYDGYQTRLHRGERVLTRHEADYMDEMAAAGQINNAYSNVTNINEYRQRSERIVNTPQTTETYDHIEYTSVAGTSNRYNETYNDYRTTKESKAKDRGRRGDVVVTGNTFHVRQESDIDSIAERLYSKWQAAAEGGA